MLVSRPARSVALLAPLLAAICSAGCRAEPAAPDLATRDLAVEESDLAAPADLRGPADLRTPADLRGPVDLRGDGPPGGTRLRIMAANLTSGDGQTYDAGEGIRILQGLKPDVALVQEFNYRTNGDTDLRAFVDTAFGAAFAYYRGTGSSIPNGVVSRYPIRSSGEWDDAHTATREYAWARIDVPGPRDLWAVSVHLLTASSTIRNEQALEIVSYVKAQVPAGDLLVIGGDLNTDSRAESCLITLGGVIIAGVPQPPADQNGNGNTNASRAKPYDWVLADGDLDVLATPVKLGASVYPGGLVFDSRVYTPLAEVSPVVSTDSAAKNMQHMGVVRDFSLPN